MLRKNGKIKKEYEHLCEKVSSDLKGMVRYLIEDQKLTEEETVGMLTSAVVLLVSQESARRRLKKRHSKSST